MTPTVPPEFVPEGRVELTEYTEEDLPALAEDIAAGENVTREEVLEHLNKLVNEYYVPVVEADRSLRNRLEYRGKL